MISGEMEEVRDTSHGSPFAAPNTEIDARSSDVAVSARASRAIPIWVAVMVLVLACLFVQTHSDLASYNFLIDGNSPIDGANVTIDGQPQGVLRALNEGGVTTTALRVHVSDGSHNVVVSKPGFQSATATVTIKGEGYLGVQLTPLAQPK